MWGRRRILLALLAAASVAGSAAASGRAAGQGAVSGAAVSASAAGPELSRAGEAWHWIQKLQTTGSVLQITAHPDDENGALLTMLSRGLGVRTALLSLTRGEAGANALGPELFDDLGWIRAAEMEAAGWWYGLDRIYFTPLADYGFSKSLEEAQRSWDEEAALAEVVEILRRERPLVVLARFNGGPEDGHGQHRFAGRLTARAFDAAPDLFAFPPREGRRGYLPGALFVRERGGDDGGGGVAEGVVSLDLSGSRAWLPYSFVEMAALGLSLQRSQTRGVVRGLGGVPGSDGGRTALLRRVDDGGAGGGSEGGEEGGVGADLLALLAPERASLGARFGAVVPRRLAEHLRELDAAFAAIAIRFDWRAPERSLPALGAALAGVRDLLGERSPSGFFDVRHELERKEEQLVAALLAAGGVRMEAVARAPGSAAGDRGPFAGPAAFGPVVPGQEFVVEVAVSALSPAVVSGVSVAGPGEVSAIEGGIGREIGGPVEGASGNEGGGEVGAEVGRPGVGGVGAGSVGAGGGEDGQSSRSRAFRVVVAEDAPPLSYPVFRSGISENRYRTEGDWSRAAPPPAFTAIARLSVPGGAGGAGRGPGASAVALPEPGLMVPIGAVPGRAAGAEDRVEVAVRVPVERFEANLPFGYEKRVLEVLPPASVAFEPDFAVAFPGSVESGFEVVLAASGHAAGEFRVALSAPAGFRVAPGERRVRFGRAGESARVRFRVFPGDGGSEGSGAGAVIRATVAAVGAGGGEPVEAVGYTRIAHRDLPLGYGIRPAALRVVALDAAPPEGLAVGFVVGAGDRVPEALGALGAEVRLLDDEALAGGPLDDFDAVVLGTRAYAFRPALIAANDRLLDYARGGGHLVVLYNTDELVPAEHAPFPGALPRRSEEVSEEDAPVAILAAGHPLLTRPYRIGPADFAGWVEQRGSKFWSGWDARYTPLFETNDAGQAPQRGGALTAAVGEGRYTYFAFALHRQLPEAVPGAFRLLANLVSWRRLAGDGAAGSGNGSGNGPEGGGGR